MKKKIYIATSWRNTHTDDVIDMVMKAKHIPYDFRTTGFNWGNIDPNWESGDVGTLATLLTHPEAVHHFNNDISELNRCDCLIMILPCGNSAHAELGYAAASGKRTIIYIPLGISVRPDLMYRLANNMCYGKGMLTNILERMGNE